MITKKTVIATTLAASLFALSSSAFASAVCSEIATHEQAAALMSRLFPDSQIISAEPLKVAVSTSCLLEVEMLTIANNPNTKGVVYVLPDGDHFLNGPLMSKRSWVGTKPQSNQGASAINLSEGQTVSQMITPAAEASETPATPAELRKKTLIDLKKNPYIKFQFSDQPAGTANVLFDVDCTYCIQQYKEMKAAAKEHNINFNWIPVYLNERSWAAAALLMRETKKDQQTGQALLDRYMNKKIGDNELATLYETLTESDFTTAKETNMIFADIVRTARVGTPLIFVENTSGTVNLSSGKLDLDEWTVMLAN